MNDAITERRGRSWDPVARGPFLERLRALGAHIERIGSWEVAVRVPGEPAPDQPASPMAVSDLSFLPKRGFYGRGAPQAVASALGLRTEQGWGAGSIAEASGCRRLMCVLHAGEVLVIDHASSAGRITMQPDALHAVDCTGGLASLALLGADVAPILRRLTAMDTSVRGFPVGRCAQTKLAEVRGLVLHVRKNYYQLHVDRADAEHVWDALLDAGRADGIRPIGWEACRRLLDDVEPEQGSQ